MYATMVQGHTVVTYVPFVQYINIHSFTIPAYAVLGCDRPEPSVVCLLNNQSVASSHGSKIFIPLMQYPTCYIDYQR